MHIEWNPFKTHDVSEFSGVFVPLYQAPRHASAVSTKSSADVEKPDGRSSTSSLAPRTENLTIEALQAAIDEDIASGGGHDTAYDRKAVVINKAILDIGYGRYQKHLFLLCGSGWLADNLWLQSIALILPALSAEFGIDSESIRYTTLSLFSGLCVGAGFWGIASDIIGRRLAFNFTLLIAGVFGLAMGGTASWHAVCVLSACLGVGIGGNLPVDGALYLEFLPHVNGNRLTLLSAWWPVGTLIASMGGWGFMSNFSCASHLQSCSLANGVQPCCGKHDNWGWRYFVLTMGAFTMVLFIFRAVIFHLFESPKFLLSKGRQAEAVAVVHGIAHYNKSKTWLSEDILNQIGGHPDVVEDNRLSAMQLIVRNLSKFSAKRIGPLFATQKLGWTTVLLWFIWAAIGMGYPLFNAFLPQYLGGGGSTSTYITYRNYAITSVCGLPGSVIAYWLVDWKLLGRKGTMALSTLVTGIFLFCFTISRDSDFQLAFSSLEALFQNVAYGVLFAYTPEVFPAPSRGTGSGICSFLNRVAGLCAPLVAIKATASAAAPIYASGALFFAAFIAMLLLPIETRGRQSL